ncbi:hypothetical protein ACPCG0_04620 [Propionibacteriaceae bacterium Y1923]|uniref:hypothetical protein n=1 Tax=Aestuariimicrobium sp. Y1814 TaxID=3418742 RepID=UPI003C14B4C7
MRWVMVQRISAMVICAVGGAALYLSPTQLGDAGTQFDQRTPSASASTTGATAAPSEANRRMAGTPSATPSPSLHADRTLPTPIRNLHLASNTGQTFTIAWRPSYDAAGIRHYVVLANGFLVGRTQQPSITLAWVNSNQRVLVQVAPVDGNGLQGEWRALMIVPPPVTLPTTAPPTTEDPTLLSVSPTPSETLPGTPSPSLSPSVSPSVSANVTLDPCSTEDNTPTATATTSTAPTVPSPSPSAQPSGSAEPTSSLSSEPGSPTGSPSEHPSC